MNTKVQSSLILAVEPDPDQSAQLTALFKRQFDADVIITPTTATALSRLAGRVPDLVLTSPLIAPGDEADLVRWLRGLGDAASHIQNVTIPVLAAPESSPNRRPGSLGFVRGGRGAAAIPDSCDPAVFADWISVYLDLAVTQRAGRN